MTGRVKVGLERVLEGAAPDLSGPALGLIVHPASVTRELVRADHALLSHPDFDVRALFGPQHGARGEKQDNMIESESFADARSRIPVYSLYGDVRKPTEEMLAGLDVLLFDLQDVGVRIYTFVWTMALAMQACREAGVRFVVLDRPNPIGGETLEGPLLWPDYASFVGLYPLPIRHGLTTGELARHLNRAFEIGCDLSVVEMEGWRRGQWMDETGLPYVMPSPNLPTLDSCAVFPGMVLLEGTNLSEGRGTTRPFELFGAPYLDPHALADEIDPKVLRGATLRPCSFEPTFQKHAGTLCGGAQIHVTNRGEWSSVAFAVELLRAVRALAPNDFAWRSPPYEYEYEKHPIDILWGSPTLRQGIDAGLGADEILAESDDECRVFAERTLPDLLYEE